VKWIVLVALIIAIISLIPASTTIGVEPQGSTRISDTGGSHAIVNDLWSTPDRPGEVAAKDTPLEPGTILLFGMGLIALTYGLKFRMFKR
jgi:PEP-CTERM motif